MKIDLSKTLRSRMKVRQHSFIPQQMDNLRTLSIFRFLNQTTQFFCYRDHNRQLLSVLLKVYWWKMKKKSCLQSEAETLVKRWLKLEYVSSLNSLSGLLDDLQSFVMSLGVKVPNFSNKKSSTETNLKSRNLAKTQVNRIPHGATSSSSEGER